MVTGPEVLKALGETPIPPHEADEFFAGIFALIEAPPVLTKIIKKAAISLSEKDKTIADLREKVAGMVTIPIATGGAFFGYSSSRFFTQVVREANIDSAQAMVEQVADRAWNAGHEKGITSRQAPLGGMTGTEFGALKDAVSALRKAMNADPSMTDAGVLHAAAQHFSQRAMGEALTKAGFLGGPGQVVQDPIARALGVASEAMQNASRAAKATAFDPDSLSAIFIRDIHQLAVGLAQQVRPCP